MGNNVYEYTPLKQQLQEVRILSIMPGLESTELECRLEHASLSDDLDYQCLSYMWGDPSNVSVISLHGYRFSVTVNLHSALHNLRKESMVVRIWIDAICINQRDTQERNAQVSMMKTIYEKARTVIVWLGEEADDSGRAMRAMSQIDRLWVTWKLSSTGNQPSSPTFSNKTLRAVDQLLQRPWWRRVWIIQESTCPVRTYFRCGSDQAHFLDIVATAKFRSYHAIKQHVQMDFTYPDVRSLYRVEAMYLLREKRAQSPFGADLLELLDNSRTHKASDPRDKIFALAGLSPTTESLAVKIDYNLPIHEVYTRFVYEFIDSVKTLDILGHCQVRLRDTCSWASFELPNSDSTPSMPKKPLPSWVPDWTLELETTLFTKNKNQYSSHPYPKEKLYNATKSFLPSVQLSKCLRTLSIRGFWFDEISMLGTDFGSPISTQKIKSWYPWSEQKLGSTYITGESTINTVSHILVADVSVSQHDGRAVRGGVAEWPTEDGIGENKKADAGKLHMGLALNSRGVFLSKKRYLGIARFDVKEGDHIVMLHGGQVPFVLSPNQGHYNFKGECYIHGLMDGEAMHYPHVWQDFVLR